MTAAQLTNEQILSLIRQLPSQAKRQALVSLAKEAALHRDERMARSEAQLRKSARERGLDWDKLDDAAREDFVNRLLHKA